MTDKKLDQTTREQALRVARMLGCQGAHETENGWMPCGSHEEYEAIKKGKEEYLKVLASKKKKPLPKMVQRTKRLETKSDAYYESRADALSISKARGCGGVRTVMLAGKRYYTPCDHKPRKGWEKLDEKPITGIATLPGGGLVTGSFSGKALGTSVGRPIGGVSEIDGDGDGLTSNARGEDKIPVIARTVLEQIKKIGPEGVEMQLAQRVKGISSTLDDQDFSEVVALDSDRRQKIVSQYDRMPVLDEKAKKAYDQFAGELDRQFKFLEEQGIKFEFVDEDPYKSFYEMHEDFIRNRRLKVMKTSVTGSHPYWSDATNDKFRAVHDVLGHLATGRGFDRHGEEAAYQAHKLTLPAEVHGALAMETRGQNAFLIERGDFPPQKAGVLPDDMIKKIFDALHTKQDKPITSDDDNLFEIGGSHHVSGGRHFPKNKRGLVTGTFSGKSLGRPIGGVAEFDGDGDGLSTGPDGEDNVPVVKLPDVLTTDALKKMRSDVNPDFLDPKKSSERHGDEEFSAAELMKLPAENAYNLSLLDSESAEYLEDQRQINSGGMNQRIRQEGVFYPIILREWADGKRSIHDGHHRLIAAYDNHPDFRVPVFVWKEEGKLEDENKSVEEKGFVNFVSRSTDPDTFSNAESARIRARNLGCIGIRRYTASDGKLVWLPCTNVSDYNRVTGIRGDNSPRNNPRRQGSGFKKKALGDPIGGSIASSGNKPIDGDGDGFVASTPGGVDDTRVSPKQEKRPRGEITKGNIDLNNRPVVKNRDGSISTVRSLTITEGNTAVVIPTVIKKPDGSGVIVSDQQAIRHYQRSGQHLGKFSNIRDADTYARNLHNQQAAQYPNPGKSFIGGGVLSFKSVPKPKKKPPTVTSTDINNLAVRVRQHNAKAKASQRANLRDLKNVYMRGLEDGDKTSANKRISKFLSLLMSDKPKDVKYFDDNDLLPLDHPWRNRKTTKKWAGFDDGEYGVKYAEKCCPQVVKRYHAK